MCLDHGLNVWSQPWNTEWRQQDLQKEELSRSQLPGSVPLKEMLGCWPFLSFTSCPTRGERTPCLYDKLCHHRPSRDPRDLKYYQALILYIVVSGGREARA